MNCFLALFLLLVACKKEVFVPETPWDQEMTASKNGKKWASYGAAAYDPKRRWISLKGEVYTQYGERRQSLYVDKIPFKVGRYTMKTDTDTYTNDGFLLAHFYAIRADGDVLEDTYNLDADKEKDCFLEVTQIDSIEHRIVGNFQVYLKIVTPKNNPENIDKLEFKKGKFDFKLIN
jgi:hypothetical protein